MTRSLWKPGRTLHVRFLDGEPVVQQKVEAIAHMWEDFANIKLAFDDDPNAEIRVSFTLGAGSWSYLGTDALTIPKNMPTMNYGWLHPNTPTQEYHRVVLHEFGHALAARRYGIQTKGITLLPIGGVAQLERMPEDPKQELWVALAGPLVNVVIAAGLAVYLTIAQRWSFLSTSNLTSGGLLERLLIVNIMLVLFNLIPAFPMDGGRVVRALLATRLEYTRATQIAASLGQALAFVFGFIGLLVNPMLLFIALFVWIGAAQESSLVQMKSSLEGIPVSRAMLTEFDVISPTDRLSRAVDLLLKGYQADFPVVDADGKVVGILTKQDLIRGLRENGETSLVSYAMTKDFNTADSNQMLDQVSACLRSGDCGTIPVLHNGDLVGMLTMENIGEFLMVQRALRKYPI